MRYLILLLILSACVTNRQATKYFDKHPDKGSGYCASKYPVKVGNVKVSEQDWSDTADSYKSASEPEQNIDGCTIVHDTVTHTINHYHVERDSIPYIDSAATHNMRIQHEKDLQTIAALQNTIIANNKAANAKLVDSDKSKKTWRLIAIIATCGFLGIRGIVWLIKRII